MPSTIEIEGTLQGDDGGRVLGFMEFLQGRIEVRDVGLVVLAMVELYDLPADVRLERPIVVGQIRPRVGMEAPHAPGGAKDLAPLLAAAATVDAATYAMAQGSFWGSSLL